MAIESRRLDVALVIGYIAWPKIATGVLYREQLFVAVPGDPPLSTRPSASWEVLCKEIILVQDCPNGHNTREFYASIVGAGLPFQTHSTSKQSVFGLIGAGFEVAFAAESQSQVNFPDVVFKPIAERNA